MSKPWLISDWCEKCNRVQTHELVIHLRHEKKNNFLVIPKLTCMECLTVTDVKHGFDDEEKFIIDDIVTRLNLDAAWLETCAPTGYQDIASVVRDAADEIERLRTELAHAQSEVARLERLATNG